MARKTDACVDTSALIAFADRSDSFHPLFRRLFAPPPPVLLTTPMVVGAWMVSEALRPLPSSAVPGHVEALPLTIAEVGAAEQLAAAEILRRFSDQDLTLVDAGGLHVMTAKRVAACWSTDFHLGVTGIPFAIRGS